MLPWEIQAKRDVELAFLIDKSHWGKGLATEAAPAVVDYARSPLGLSRLICLITPSNVASIRVATKIGMSFEREHDDEWGLFHIYACTLGKRADALPIGQTDAPIHGLYLASVDAARRLTLR